MEHGVFLCERKIALKNGGGEISVNPVLFPDAFLRVKSYCTKDDFSCQERGIGIAFARSGNSS
jgi:hypothetical protein